MALHGDCILERVNRKTSTDFHIKFLYDRDFASRSGYYSSKIKLKAITPSAEITRFELGMIKKTEVKRKMFVVKTNLGKSIACDIECAFATRDSATGRVLFLSLYSLRIFSRVYVVSSAPASRNMTIALDTICDISPLGSEYAYQPFHKDDRAGAILGFMVNGFFCK